MKNILIVGATSAIATACARRWASHGARFYLVARNGDRVRQVADDLLVQGATLAEVFVLDIDDIGSHEAMLSCCVDVLGRIDIALVAPGTLPDQHACQSSTSIALREFTTNALSPIALLTPLANLFEAQRVGTIAVISSVAGDRGRASNYLYGSAKAALSAFCSGLDARLCRAGARVMLIKPGFVATPMTHGLTLPAPLVATPQRVAADIVRAIGRGSSELYTPWFWAAIMWVIRAIPRPVFRRLPL
jgi:decaprenylphospho-beta-D-erythro-pentofuranosid-2-ulose 2-reductase